MKLLRISEYVNELSNSIMSIERGRKLPVSDSIPAEAEDVKCKKLEIRVLKLLILFLLYNNFQEQR